MPWTTLIRSYTTRRSAPITRSRLRRPTSKSTTTTLPISLPSTAVSIEGRHHQRITFEPDLHWPAAQRCIDIIGRLIEAVDRQKLCFDLAAEDPRAGVAGRTRHGSASQCAVNVNRTTSNDFGARSHGADHGHVAVWESYGLT